MHSDKVKKYAERIDYLDEKKECNWFGHSSTILYPCQTTLHAPCDALGDGRKIA